MPTQELGTRSTHSRVRHVKIFMLEILLIFILKREFTNLKGKKLKSYFYRVICVCQVSFISVLRTTVLAKVGVKVARVLK